MANYNKALLLKETAKMRSLPAESALPKMPGWTPDHIRTGRAWIGKNPLLERNLDVYLQSK